VPSKKKDFSKSVINYIEENYSKNITSKSASEELRYDQSYFCRTFKKLFGLKFNEYLNIHRIKVAKELLKTESVSTAATKSGFSSISYFSVVFKKITGLTPMQYRVEKQ
jgi:two-component system response regulator YesN